METEQYIVERPVGHQRNMGEIKLSSNLMKMKTQLKAVLRGKLIAMISYVLKKERSQISSLTMYLKFLEKKNKPNHKLGGKK
jgi:NAD+--asparagine ADP-ribosyltransferase